MKLAVIYRFDTAVDLIQRGLRLSIVSHTTDIPMKTLRSLHHEIHRRSPPAGQLPSLRSMLTTRCAQAIASVFAALYRSAGGSAVYERIDMPTVLTAHELYLSLLRDTIFTNHRLNRSTSTRPGLSPGIFEPVPPTSRSAVIVLSAISMPRISAWRPVVRSAP